MNRDKVLSAKGMDITTLWNATEDPFWKDFYKEQTGIASTSGQALAPNNCMNYLYNLGVAAIVHTLKRTSEDLLKRNIGSPVLPPYLAIDTAVIVYALEKAIDPPTLSEEPGLLLGFAPTGRTPFPDRLRNFEQIFRVDRLDALNPNQVSETLAAVQGSAERELLLTGRWQAAAPDENLPRFDSSFGIYAVTCPTLEECPDRQRLNQYLDRCEVQHYKAHLLNRAMTIATLNATARAARLVGTPLEIDQARQSLERQRDEAVRARAILRSQPPVPASPVHLVNPGERPIPQNVRAAGR
jgi:hypothetical protein